MFFTTSWDDGYVLDLKLAELLEKYSCTGTFYICPQDQHGREMLTKEQIQKLADHHEVGAHSMTHPKLTQIPPEEAKREIEGSKKWIEGVTGKPCTMFCYPHGNHNKRVQEQVQQTGFRGGRTTRVLAFDVSNPFALPTSLQIFQFSNLKLRTLMPTWFMLLKNISSNAHTKDWLSLARFLLGHARETGRPFFHLWGHSFEIEKYDMWKDLEIFLEEVQQSDVRCVTNYELLEATALSSAGVT